MSEEFHETLDELERELSLPPKRDLPEVLRERVRNHVHAAKREDELHTEKQKTIAAALFCLAIAASIASVFLRLSPSLREPASSTETRLATTAGDRAMQFPTIHAFRLPQDVSPHQWESWVEQRVDRFSSAHAQTRNSISWTDRSRLLGGNE